MTRNDKLLLGLDLDRATGIEVGALDKPIIPPSSPGAFFVDHMDTPSLREKYRGDANVNADNLVHVSGIWGEKGLAEIAAAVAPVDFLVASHVIEHVPNLIAWLNEIASVLKSTGSLRLAIPDRRYTFDLLRTETVLADVLAAHLVGARIPQIRQVIDDVANVSRVDCWKAWDGTLDRTALEKYHDPSAIEILANDVLENQNYHDVHCWVFTPTSFAQLMGRMAEIGYHSFKCVRFFDTEYHHNEFIVVAQPGAERDDAVASWKAMFEGLERIREAKEAEARASEVTLATEGRDAEIRVLHEKIVQLEATIDAIKESTSWRVTAPMRSAVRALRKVGQ
jgi:hypothetical protein